MEANAIQPDSIACSALMRAFNKGGEPASRVLVLADLMRKKRIPFIDAILYEMVSACSILGDWKTTIDLIKMMEPSFPVVSIGLLNQLLHSLGKSGKSEIMMKVLQWMENAEIRPSILMYRDILSFAQKSSGSEYAAIIKEKIESLKKKHGNQISTSKIYDSPLVNLPLV